jgi:RNA polymerase sigma-70 factor, ECF subfamily
VLHHIAGLSVEEIADETGVAVGTVKARLSRGRKALTEHLSDGDAAVGRFGNGVPQNG